MNENIADIINQFDNFEDFYQWFINNYEGAGNLPRANIERLYNVYKSQANASQTGDYSHVLETVSDNQAQMSPEYEKWLDSMMSNQRTVEDRNYQTAMRDSSLLSAASQLGQLGLSSSNVIQTGGASSGVTSNAAAISKHSAVQMRQQERINNFNQKMGLAKSLIGAASSMASSGIYGAALGAMKHSASVMASSVAHSGMSVLKKWSGAGNGSLLSGKLGEEWSKLPGAY